MRRWAVVAALLVLSACQPDKAAEEAARQESVVLTSGQALDCTAALGEAGHMVCADPDLRALDRQLAERWTEVSDLTGRPTTWARRHADWMAERDAGQLDYETGERRARTIDELRGLYEAQLSMLDEEKALADALPDTSPVTALAGGCIGTALQDCRAPAAGYVTAPSGERLAWQLQEGEDEYGGRRAGMVLFSVDGEVLTPVGWSYEAARFDPPVMFEREGSVFVVASGWHDGTSSQNADILYRLDRGHWTEIELESWKTTLDEQLPEGLGVWKGVAYRWEAMEALSSLWRDGDANCCATGGSATFSLRIEGAAVRLADVTIRPPEA